MMFSYNIPAVTIPFMLLLIGSSLVEAQHLRSQPGTEDAEVRCSTGAFDLCNDLEYGLFGLLEISTSMCRQACSTNTQRFEYEN